MERRKMAAKFPGRCAECGERFPVGTEILWAKGEGARHAVCAPEEEIEVVMLRREREEEERLMAINKRILTEPGYRPPWAPKYGPWSSGWLPAPRGWRP